MEVRLTGMVLRSAPYGEYDRRIILLTRERGKITAFARGARRPGSTLLAAAGVFRFGTFVLYEGRTAYTLAAAEITHYFSDLQQDLEASFYASYFAELAGYYGRENLDASDMLNLLYLSMKALENRRFSNKLVRYIFEIRLLVINGEFPQDVMYDMSLLESTRYALQFIVRTPLQKLFTFSVSEAVLDEMAEVQDAIRRRTIDSRLRSLEILDQMTAFMPEHNG